MRSARGTWFVTLVALVVPFTSVLTGITVRGSDPAPPIIQLKPIYRETALVRDGQPTAAIVVPANERYDALAAKIVAAVKQTTGVTLPIVRDEDIELPFDRNLLILGNRSTNRLMEQLYNFYYTYLDLKYPGAGGYVVRSLHNPLADGHNAILIGSSDDAGMVKAATQFARLAADAAQQGSFSLGWTLRVELGEGWEVPPSANDPACLAWGSNEAPATYFGWNSVGRNMALYYMTGDERFAREFLRLAFPDAKAIQEMWEVDGERIEVKEHPLAGSYHYCAHPMILLWDLIEESPVFSDKQRLRVTREFAGGGDHYHVPGSRFVGDRHATYQALMVYCRARYFDKYYPHPAWEAAKEKAAAHFASLNRTIHIDGPQDTPNSGHAYVNTGYEPIMSYMLISGDRRGVESGILGTILRGYDGLISGQPDDAALGFQTLSFANKAACLTGDARFIYYRNLMSAPTDCFRIGQSFWPDHCERAPDELARRISVRPLSHEGCAGRSVPAEEAFHWLTYRGGPTGSDDYLKIGGMYDQTRRPYYCLNLERLRVGPTTLLASGDYSNTVIARRQGLIASELPLESALKVQKVVGHVAHVEAEVPKFAFGVWRRAMLHAAGRWTVVNDRLTAHDAAEGLEFRIQWALPGTPKLVDDGHFEYPTGDTTAVVVPATHAELKVGARSAQCTLRGDVEAGERLEMTTLVGLAPEGNGQHFACARLTDAAAVLSVPQPVLVLFDKIEMADGEVQIDAGAALVGSDLIYASDVRRLACGPTLLAANRPVDVCWTPSDGSLTLFCAEPTALGIAAARGRDLCEAGHSVLVTRIADGLIWTRLERGSHTITGATMPTATADKLRDKLEALHAASSREAPKQSQEALPTDLPALQVTATCSVQGGVTRILPGPERNGSTSVYAATDADRAYAVSVDGRVDDGIEAADRIMSAAYWPEPDLLLLGCADDRVYAFDRHGRSVWSFRSEMHPDVYATGKTYWFKEDLPGIYGLQTGRLDNAASRAFVGSACTVEVLDAAGQLVKRVPLYWGSCAVMEVVPNTDGTCKLVVAKAPNLSNDLSTVDGADWSTGSFGVHPPFQLSQSTRNILVEDLDGDGQVEVICDTNGSMNNVRVYDCLGKVRWSADFGPPAVGPVKIGIAVPRTTMRGLAVVDFQKTGDKYVAAATEEGLVTAFRTDGAQAWARYLPSAPWCLAKVPREGGDLLAVACDDGTLLLMDAGGKPVAQTRLEGAVRQVRTVETSDGPLLVAGTNQGTIAILHP